MFLTIWYFGMLNFCETILDVILQPLLNHPTLFFSCLIDVQPTKAEKEPMRHLYDKYNGLKHQIRDVEGLLVAHRQQVRVVKHVCVYNSVMITIKFAPLVPF